MRGLKRVDYQVNIVPEECKASNEMTFENLPALHMRPGIERWVHLGIPPGDFMQAIICNDLRMAVHYADDTNRELLLEWVVWFHNNVPAPCWGSIENAKAWQEHRQDALKAAIKAQEMIHG